MERKLTKVVDGTEITETEKMCSCGADVANDLCSWECPDTCGNSLSAVEETLILCGLAGFFEGYVPVFLAGKNENLE